MAFLGSAAKSTAGMIAPVGNTLSVYDALAAFASGLTPTSTITDISANYTWSQTTIVVFEYVKKVGQNDDSQILTYISSSVTTWVGWTIPGFTSNSTGAVRPVGTAGDKYIYSTPAGFDNTYNAAWAYADVNAPKNDYVNYVTLSGFESKVLVNIYPLIPSFPIQIYKQEIKSEV